MEYKIILNTFEGPLDLLLHLIEKAKVDIYDIPISEITDQYIEYLNQMKELDLEVTSEFLVMAATLLEVKSKMLLPAKRSNTCEGTQLEMEEIDPRLDLVKKLVEYKKYKTVAEELKIREERQSKVFYKPKEDFNQYIEEDDIEFEEMSLDKLVEVLNKVLKKSDYETNSIDIEEIKRDEVTLEECVNKLKQKLEIEEKIKFSQLFQDKTTRSEVIAIFLSILELTKSKYIKIKQENNFADIIIIKR